MLNSHYSSQCNTIDENAAFGCSEIRVRPSHQTYFLPPIWKDPLWRVFDPSRRGAWGSRVGMAAASTTVVALQSPFHPPPGSGRQTSKLIVVFSSRHSWRPLPPLRRLVASPRFGPVHCSSSGENSSDAGDNSGFAWRFLFLFLIFCLF